MMSEPRPLDSDRFEISVDGSGAMIRYRMKGFWDAGCYARFHEAILREMLAQDARAMGLRKCGVVTSSPLVKMQLDRLSNHFYQFFTSEADALAWIRT